ncbi:MAG: type I-C CRISPR-associated protein Cas8c/Csd1 [Chloroflexota bacterium]|nr:type I-C CRISPR-associated protein Cas8c/Csd1 [Chloroflexota bacterium]
MILQALAGYYQRLADEGGADIAAEGFENKEIPFLIILNQRGEFVDLQDTRTPLGKKLIGRKFLVPKEQERSGTKAWQKANLLWDHYGYVLARPKSDDEANKEMALKQHRVFVATVRHLFEKYPEDEEIRAVYQFLSAGRFEGIYSHRCWPDCARIPGCNLSFQLQGQFRLVCESENVRAYVVATNNPASDDEGADDTALLEMRGICLVTGEYGPIARTHPRTPILDPRAKSNAKIVSFQRNMGFDSYGKQQGFNAPVGKSTAFAYTTALNHMLTRGSRQRIQVGDATTVFWAEKKHDFETVFADIFGAEPAKGEPEQDYKSLVALFRSPESGARADTTTRFYVLGLAPNAARLAVRFWYAGTVGSIAENIGQHFDDLEMVKSPREWHTIGLRWLLRSTALQQKDDNIPPNLAGDTMRAILSGAPYPQTLLASAIRRCRAEREITYTRAALVKAVLARDARHYKRQEKEVGMSLDMANTNQGYVLGRLFAVLERAQERASPGINATIRDRFYGAASGTPVAVFPLLMKLKNHHIAKLENKGEAVNLEKQIGEIMGKVDGDKAFPTHLSLQDQGRFAVGYYHQRQDFFKGTTGSKE